MSSEVAGGARPWTGAAWKEPGDEAMQKLQSGGRACAGPESRLGAGGFRMMHCWHAWCVAWDESREGRNLRKGAGDEGSMVGNAMAQATRYCSLVGAQQVCGLPLGSLWVCVAAC